MRHKINELISRWKEQQLEKLGSIHDTNGILQYSILIQYSFDIILETQSANRTIQS